MYPDVKKVVECGGMTFRVSVLCGMGKGRFKYNGTMYNNIEGAIMGDTKITRYRTTRFKQFLFTHSGMDEGVLFDVLMARFTQHVESHDTILAIGHTVESYPAWPLYLKVLCRVREEMLNMMRSRCVRL